MAVFRPLTVRTNTLGLSYVRYWLPLSLLILPFIVYALIWLVQFIKSPLRNYILFLFIALLFYQSANLVLWQKVDSLLPVKERIATYKQVAEEINNLTPANSVVVTVRKDKVFFPERKVIHTFDNLPDNKQLLEILPKLVKVAPVYYYALAPEKDILLKNNLKLKLIKNIGEEVLYQIQIVESLNN